MPVPSSGQISLNDFHVEAGGTSGSACTLNDADIRGLISKGSGAAMNFNEWYGASASIHSSSFVTYYNDGDYFDESGWNRDTSTMDTTISGTFQGSTNVIIPNDFQSLANVAGQLTFQLGVSSGSKTFTNSGWTTLNLWVNNSTGSGSPTLSLTRSTATFSTPTNKGSWYWYIGNQYGNTSAGGQVNGVFGTSSNTSFMELV
jgi:hypothetical protein